MTVSPQFIYGTAWKKEATTRLVKAAITAGFTAIDTANQPKHYNEPLVGQALEQLQGEKRIDRQQLFLQTKFTPLNSQDNRVPYDPTASLTEQVNTSFKSSLEHLQTDYVDSYLLHGPYGWPGLNEADWEVWRAIEAIYTTGKTKFIGISNVNIQQLQTLMATANIKPMFVQNRCFAKQGWDKAVREFCKANNILYQGFSLLTANPEALQNKNVIAIAQRLHKTVEQIIFRFSQQIGMISLTGTSDTQHMKQDLAINDFKLTEEEIIEIEKIYPVF